MVKTQKDWTIRSQNPNLVYVRARIRFNDSVKAGACIDSTCTKVMGLRRVTISYDGLRYSLRPTRHARVKYLEREGISAYAVEGLIG